MYLFITTFVCLFLHFLIYPLIITSVYRWQRDLRCIAICAPTLLFIQKSLPRAKHSVRLHNYEKHALRVSGVIAVLLHCTCKHGILIVTRVNQKQARLNFVAMPAFICYPSIILFFLSNQLLYNTVPAKASQDTLPVLY